MIYYCNAQLMPHRMALVFNEPLLEIQEKGNIDIKQDFLLAA
jgi:hypothetical protein